MNIELRPTATDAEKAEALRLIADNLPGFVCSHDDGSRWPIKVGRKTVAHVTVWK